MIAQIQSHIRLRSKNIYAPIRFLSLILLSFKTNPFRIPVTIEILDHNDHELKFDGNDYYASLVEDNISESILIVKAHDDDCTNDGFACSYEIVNNDDVPFKINKLGFISNTKALKRSDKAKYDLIIRGYDCLDNKYVETNVHIEVKEHCRPEWKSNEILSLRCNFIFKLTSYLFKGENKIITATSVETQIFTNLEIETCSDEQASCTLDGYKTRVELDLNGFLNECESENCGSLNILTKLNEKIYFLFFLIK